jgi:hypothetical protein
MTRYHFGQAEARWQIGQAPVFTVAPPPALPRGGRWHWQLMKERIMIQRKWSWHGRERQ